MTENFKFYTNKITDRFAEEFGRAYDSVKKKKKSDILKYTASFYKKWYYSTLLNDTVLSPANLIAMLAKSSGMSVDTYMEISSIEKKQRKPLRFEYKTLTYTMEDHHIVRDLKIVTDMFDPDLELTANDSFDDAALELLMNKISLRDPFYVDYLLLIGSELNLVKKLPSIYSNKAQKTQECDEFFAKPGREIFDAIVSKSIELTAFYLQGILPVQETFFSPDYIYKILSEPVDTDEIFSTFFSFLGVELTDEIFKESNEDQEFVQFMKSSTFVLGLMLDRYFYTVYGYYLKLIRPLYVLKLEFGSELQYYFESEEEDDGPVTALFSPCSCYFHTPMGASYFGVEENDDMLTPPKNVPVELAVSLALNDLDYFDPHNMELLNKYMLDKQAQSDTIYEIKVRVMEDRQLWKNIEVHSNSTLMELYLEICFSMGFEQSGSFSFFTDMTGSPFSEYPSRPKSKRKKGVVETSLEELNLTDKQRFMLVLYECFYPFTFEDSEETDTDEVKDIRLELELLKVKPRKVNKIYPRVSRMSQAFTEMDYDEFDGIDF